MTPEAVTSVITFILNSVLLSSFIIPQVQKLKEIKDRLFQFQLPGIPPTGTLPRAMLDSLREPGKEVEKLQAILDIYRVRSTELRATLNTFYISVLLAAVTLVASAVWSQGRDLFLTVYPVLQLGLLLWAIRSYGADPDRVSSPLYLVKECEINPHLVIAAMGMSITFSSGLPISQRQDWEDPLNIDLCMKLRVYGFRFFFVIADAEGKVYYVSFGPITAQTNNWRHLLNPACGMNEINSTNIGKFQFNHFATAKTFTCHLLVFLPFFKHEKLNPMLRTESVCAGGRGGNMISAAGTTGKVESDRVYRGITFSGTGEKIVDVGVEDLPKDNNPAINRVVRKFQKEFLQASEIKSLTDIEGLIAAE